MGFSCTLLGIAEQENAYLVYFIAILVGCTQAIILNMSITLISDVIGLKGKSGAFVFGSYSFFDKVITGITIFCISESPDFNNATFARWVTVLVPGIACFVAWVFVVSGHI